MNALNYILLFFALIGVLDKIFGDKFGYGKEFEKGFSLFAPMALSMIGMIVVAPWVGEKLEPIFEGFYNFCKIDPSIITASLFANDMGGVTLSLAACKSAEIGAFNAYVVSSMMGCVISFTIPLAATLVPESRKKELFFGLLCGIATIPFGCFVSGLTLKIGILDLLLDLLPLVVLSAAICLALVFFQNACVKIFEILGILIKSVALIGFGLSIFTFLTEIKISPLFDTFENGAAICANACVTLSGALPLMLFISKVLKKPLEVFGKKTGVCQIATLSLLSTLVTNVTTFKSMDEMNKKGAALNSAFAVSAAFTLGGHLAYTNACDPSYVFPVILGKIISGVLALVLVFLTYKDKTKDIAQNAA